MIEFPRSITGVDTFGQRLRHARELRRHSQERLAEISGVSQSAISSYENGTRRATTQLIALAKALAVAPAWLGDGLGPMEPPPISGGHALHDAAAAWPFQQITPDSWWRLSHAQRQAVEDAIRALMAIGDPKDR